MDTKFSIITTAYNAEAFIKECVLSVINQTYQNWELIIVNDGSTDNTESIVNSVTSEHTEISHKIKYIKHENSGAVYSREVGIDKASGDYIMFLDSDDWWNLDLLEKINEQINSTHADIIQYGYVFVDENGKPIEESGISKKGGNGKNTEILLEDKNEFIYTALGTSYSLWSKAFKSSLFNTPIGFLREYYDVNMANDLLALAKPLCSARSYCTTDFYLYNYRIVKSSLSHNISIKKISSYLRSFGWAEKCSFAENGLTNEHLDFFSNRLSTIVFDEYREIIYAASNNDIKEIYAASDNIPNRNLLLKRCLKDCHNWYKSAYLWSFLHKKILLPKLLHKYTQLRNHAT